MWLSRLRVLFFSATNLQCFTDTWGVSSFRFLIVCHWVDHNQDTVEMVNCGVSSFANMGSVYSFLWIMCFTNYCNCMHLTLCSPNWLAFQARTSSDFRLFFFPTDMNFLSFIVYSERNQLRYTFFFLFHQIQDSYVGIVLVRWLF